MTSCLAQKLQGVLNCCPWIPRGGSKEGTEPWAVHVHLYCTCLAWGTASAVTSKAWNLLTQETSDRDRQNISKYEEPTELTTPQGVTPTQREWCNAAALRP